jgi:hypothetical protein
MRLILAEEMTLFSSRGSGFSGRVGGPTAQAADFAVAKLGKHRPR